MIHVSYTLIRPLYKQKYRTRMSAV